MSFFLPGLRFSSMFGRRNVGPFFLLWLLLFLLVCIQSVGTQLAQTLGSVLLVSFKHPSRGYESFRHLGAAEATRPVLQQ